MGQHLPRVADEGGEEVVLDGGEMQVFAGQEDSASFEIHREVADGGLGSLFASELRRVAQGHADAREEFPNAEGFVR